jgi:hypothetical protein
MYKWDPPPFSFTSCNETKKKYFIVEFTNLYRILIKNTTFCTVTNSAYHYEHSAIHWHGLLQAQITFLCQFYYAQWHDNSLCTKLAFEKFLL